MASSAEYSLERLAARAEIQDRIHSWTRAVDRRDWALAATVFHVDAYDDHGVFQGDVDGLIAKLAHRYKSIRTSFHQVGNILIEFSDDQTAVAESYLFVWLRHDPADTVERAAVTESSDNSVFMSARYVDLFSKRDDAWKITRRITVFDEVMHFNAPGDSTPFKPGFFFGRHGSDDVLGKLRKEVGLSVD